MPAIEPALRASVGTAVIAVDSPREIFANKLCALLGRSELRDLVDVKVLMDAGLPLDDALRDAARKDGGFSPLTLAWIVQQLAVERLAATGGLQVEETAALIAFRNELATGLAKVATPAR